MQFIPPIETTGIWTLAAPFNAKLTDKTPYTLIAIRKLSDILATGGDPETEYYTANSLDGARYKADVAANVSILTLQGTFGDVIYIPSSAVMNYPDIGGVPYTVMALAVSLGALPNSLDLSHVKARVASVIQETLGVVATINTLATSQTALLTNADADLAEQARLTKITLTETDYARALRVETQLISAQQRIAELEAFILANKAKLITV